MRGFARVLLVPGVCGNTSPPHPCGCGGFVFSPRLGRCYFLLHGETIRGPRAQDIYSPVQGVQIPKGSSGLLTAHPVRIVPWQKSGDLAATNRGIFSPAPRSWPGWIIKRVWSGGSGCFKCLNGGFFPAHFVGVAHHKWGLSCCHSGQNPTPSRGPLVAATFRGARDDDKRF